MSQPICEDVLQVILLFDQDPFETLSTFRLVCKDWNEWIHSHDFLQQYILSTLKKNWAIRNEPPRPMKIPFQTDLFRLHTLNSTNLKLAFKYHILTRRHISQFTDQLNTFQANVNFPITEPSRVVNEKALKMSALLSPFLFLTYGNTTFGSYEQRSNTAHLIIANIKGEDKFVKLQYYVDRCDYPGANDLFLTVKLVSHLKSDPEIDHDSFKSLLAIKKHDFEELLFDFKRYRDGSSTFQWNGERVVELMRFVGLDEDFSSDIEECRNNFLFIVMYELILKSIECWWVDETHFQF